MQVQEEVRWKNLNTLERIERKKISVSGDNVRGATRNREFEEFVVHRIAASCYPHIDINPLPFACQCRDKESNVLFVYVSTESFPT